MKITQQASDDAILAELGSRLSQARLAKNLTQAQLAVQAGISKRTVERLESGAVAAQLSAFLRVCRALGLLAQFETLIPENPVSPIAQLQTRGRQRRRASSPGPAANPPPAPGGWTWNEKT